MSKKQKEKELSANDPYLVNLLITLALVVIGLIGGYFLARGQTMAAKNGQQDKTVLNQKDLIESFEKKIVQIKEEHTAEIAKLQAQITALQIENEQLKATVDSLVIEKQSRDRVSHRAKQPTPIKLPTTKISKAVNPSLQGKKEEETK